MNKTFGTMKLNVGNNVQDTSPEMASVIGVYLNSRLTEVRQRLNIFGTERTDYTFSTVAGTANYVMPDDFGKETNVLDITNNIELKRDSTQFWARNNANDIDAQGQPRKYTILTDVVRTQPTSASMITVVSSSGSDSGTIHVRGLVSGVERSENIVLNGTSDVTGLISFDRILGLSKDVLSTGTITVSANSGASILAYMAPNQLVSRVTVMKLSEIPNGVVTIQVVYLTKQLPMVSAYDYPNVDCDEALEHGATADAWRYKRQFMKAAQFEALFEKVMANLAFNTDNQPNLVNKFNPQPYPRSIY